MKTIETSNGQQFLVDDEDYEKLSQFKWGTVGKTTNFYASRGVRPPGEKYRKILMHRFIMHADAAYMVDHINGNTLDNRKENLRLATRGQNLRNSKLRSDSKSSYKGVGMKVSKSGTVRYNARIQISPKNRLYLGLFVTEKEAAQAYNDAAIKHFGEFANLNVITQS